MSQPAKTSHRKSGFRSLLALINDPFLALSNRGVARALNGDPSGAMQDLRAAIRHRAELGARDDKLSRPAASNDERYTPR